MEEQDRLAGQGLISENAADIMVRYRTTRSTWHYVVQFLVIVAVIAVVLVVLELVR